MKHFGWHEDDTSQKTREKNATKHRNIGSKSVTVCHGICQNGDALWWSPACDCWSSSSVDDDSIHTPTTHRQSPIGSIRSKKRRKIIKKWIVFKATSTFSMTSSCARLFHCLCVWLVCSFDLFGFVWIISYKSDYKRCKWDVNTSDRRNQLIISLCTCLFVYLAFGSPFSRTHARSQGNECEFMNMRLVYAGTHPICTFYMRRIHKISV